MWCEWTTHTHTNPPTHPHTHTPTHTPTHHNPPPPHTPPPHPQGVGGGGWGLGCAGIRQLSWVGSKLGQHMTPAWENHIFLSQFLEWITIALVSNTIALEKLPQCNSKDCSWVFKRSSTTCSWMLKDTPQLFCFVSFCYQLTAIFATCIRTWLSSAPSMRTRRSPRRESSVTNVM